jgi:1,4-dihydroxy-2-naphthoate octaprenyltransferase
MLLSVAYSHPTPRWKGRPILSLLVVAFGQGAIAFASGWLVSSASPELLFGSLSGALGLAVATLITVGFYPLTQLYQIDEDRARGDRTFAVAFGPNTSFDFALACLGVGGLMLLILAFHLFGVRDALLAGAALVLFLLAIIRWRRRFRNRVTENFWALHRLQLGLSLATLGYVGLRLIAY